jgi:hypothetical protein
MFQLYDINGILIFIKYLIDICSMFMGARLSTKSENNIVFNLTVLESLDKLFNMLIKN